MKQEVLFTNVHFDPKANIRAALVAGSPAVVVQNPRVTGGATIHFAINHGAGWTEIDTLEVDKPWTDFQTRAAGRNLVIFGHDDEHVLNVVVDTKTLGATPIELVNDPHAATSGLASTANAAGDVGLTWKQGGSLNARSNVEGVASASRVINTPDSTMQLQGLSYTVVDQEDNQSVIYSPEGQKLYYILIPSNVGSTTMKPTQIYSTNSSGDTIVRISMTAASELNTTPNFTAVVRQPSLGAGAYTIVGGALPDPSDPDQALLQLQKYLITSAVKSSIFLRSYAAEHSVAYYVDKDADLQRVSFDQINGFSAPQVIANGVDKLWDAATTPNGAEALAYSYKEFGDLNLAIRPGTGQPWSLIGLGIQSTGAARVALDDGIAFVAALDKNMGVQVCRVPLPAAGQEPNQ